MGEICPPDSLPPDLPLGVDRQLSAASTTSAQPADLFQLQSLLKGLEEKLEALRGVPQQLTALTHSVSKLSVSAGENLREIKNVSTNITNFASGSGTGSHPVLSHSSSNLGGNHGINLSHSTSNLEIPPALAADNTGHLTDHHKHRESVAAMGLAPHMGEASVLQKRRWGSCLSTSSLSSGAPFSALTASARKSQMAPRGSFAPRMSTMSMASSFSELYNPNGAGPHNSPYASHRESLGNVMSPPQSRHASNSSESSDRGSGPQPSIVAVASNRSQPPMYADINTLSAVTEDHNGMRESTISRNSAAGESSMTSAMISTMSGVRTSSTSATAETREASDIQFGSEGFPSLVKEEHGKSGPKQNKLRHALTRTSMQLPTMSRKSRVYVEQHRCSTMVTLAPSSPVRVAWDFAILTNIILAGIVIPLNLVYFEGQPNQGIDYVLLYFIDIMWPIDILMNFRTGYFVSGELECRQSKMAAHYAKGWLLLDLLAVWPIAFTDKGSSAYTIVCMLKAPRLLQALPRFLQLQGLHLGQGLLPCFIAVIAVLAVHILACAWRLAIRADIVPTDSHETISKQYVNDVYWVSTTMTSVGFGDITPVGVISKLFAMVVMLLGSAIFGGVVSGFSMVLGKKFNNEALQKISELTRFMNRRTVPRDLQRRVRANLRQQYGYSEHCVMSPELLASLSPAMQRELCLSILSDTVLHFPLFRNVPRSFVAELAQAHCWEQVLPGDLVTDEGHMVEDVVFVVEGTLQCCLSAGGDGGLDMELKARDDRISHQASGVPLVGEARELKVGAWFGEAALFSADHVYTSVITAVTICELSILPAPDYFKVLCKYPRLQERHNDIKKALLEDRATLRGLRYNAQPESNSVDSGKRGFFGNGWKQLLRPFKRNEDFSGLVPA